MIGHVRETHENCDRVACCVCELYVCKVCGCLEGSLLPVCPGRRVTMEEQDAYYKHYCAGTGPFARATFDTVDLAKNACYYRLHPQAFISTTRGARILYDAVCELWCHVAQFPPCAVCSRKKEGGVVQPANKYVCNDCLRDRVCP
jgi:hypothetical protein